MHAPCFSPAAVFTPLLCRPNGLTLFVELGAECVPFLAGDFEVEHQVFDVEAELGEGFLDEVENAAATADAIDDLLVTGGQFTLGGNRQSFDPLAQFDQFPREFLCVLIIEA